MFGRKKSREEYTQLTPVSSGDRSDDIENNMKKPTKPMESTSGSKTSPAMRKKAMWRMASMLWPERYRLVIAFSFLAVSSLAAILIPQYLGSVIEATTENDRKALNRAAIDVIALSMVSGLGSFFRSWLFTLSGHRIVAKLRKEVFHAILSREVSWFDENKTGELTSRLSSDCTSVQTALTVNFSMLVRNLCQITGYLIFLFAISGRLTALIFMIVPLIAVLTFVYVRFVKVRESLTRSSTVMHHPYELIDSPPRPTHSSIHVDSTDSRKPVLAKRNDHAIPS